jgi:hypothetical protein
MALLDAARGGDDPSVDDRARVRAAVARQIVVGVAVGAAAATAAKTASGVVTAGAAGAGAGAAVGGGAVATGAGLGGLGAKLLVSVAIVGAVGMGTAGTVKMVRHREEERARVAQVEVAARVAASVAASSRAHASDIPPPPSEEDLRATTPIEIPTPSPSAAPEWVFPSRAPPARAPSAPSPSPLDAELALLRTAHDALKAHDPAAALRALDEHARRFPDGAMVEEREASRVFALCDLARTDEATDAASRFLREHPSSPLAARVAHACDGSR